MKAIGAFCWGRLLHSAFAMFEAEELGWADPFIHLLSNILRTLGRSLTLQNGETCLFMQASSYGQFIALKTVLWQKRYLLDGQAY